MEEEEIIYALAKHVPDARYKLQIHTNYGYITLEGDDANFIAEKLKDLLEHKLNTGDYEK